MSQLSAHSEIIHKRNTGYGSIFGIPFVMICLVSDLISAVIIGTCQPDPILDLLLILLSLPLLLFPPSLMPLIFVSSWSISFGVSFLAGYFYYFTLLLLSLLLNRSYVKMIKSISLPEWFLIVFCVWTLLVGVRSVSGDFYISLKTVLYMVPALSMFHIRLKGTKYLDNVIFVITAIFSIIFFYHALVSPYYIEIEGTYTTRYQITVMDGINTNTASQVVTVNFLLLLIHSLKKNSVPGLAVASLNLYSIFAMGSRTSFFTLVFCAALYLLLNRKKTGIKLIFVFLTAILAFVAVKIGSGLEGMERLNIMSIVDDQGSGRFVNWALYFLEILPYYWSSGIGVTKYNYEFLGYEFDADNLYVDLLCETGIIGFLLFMCFYISLSSRLYKYRKEYGRLDASWIVLVSFFIFGAGETVFDAPLFWCVAMYSVIGITNSTADYDAAVTKSVH